MGRSPAFGGSEECEEEALENIQDAIHEYFAAVKEMSRGQEVYEIDIAA